MTRIPDGYRVALARDRHYSRYHPELKKGATGVVAPPFGTKSSVEDRFVRVHFTLPSRELAVDVQWFDLEVTDPRWTAGKENERRAFELAVACYLREARLHLGPKGGFRRLELSYLNGRPDDVFEKEKEAPAIAALRARGLVREILEREGGLP